MNLDAGVIDTLSTWEELADLGRTLAGDMDAHRFTLGDVGARCAVVYGEDSLSKLASDIGMARAHTFREYVRVARRYEPVTRVTFLEAGLNWTHFREAARAKDDAELWLARAADEGWPTAELVRQLKAALGQPTAPRVLYSGPGVVWQYANDSRPYLVLDGDVSALAAGLKVTVKVMEVNADA